MAIYKENYIDVNLESGTITRSFLNHTIGLGDIKANRFGVRVFRDGEPVNIEGTSCQGFFMRPDGTPLHIHGSSYTGVSGNEGYVELPQDAYAFDGQFTLAIKLIGGGVTGTMRIVDGVVNNTGATGAVSPTSTVPTSAEIIAAYEDAMAVIDSAIRFDITQSLTDAEKKKARSNINAGDIEMTAELFDSSQAYAEGEYVTYNGDLYQFKKAHAAGSWASGDVTAVNVGEEMEKRVRALGIFSDNTKYSDLNTLPANTFACFNSTGATNIAHKPTTDITVSTLQVLTLSTDKTLNSGALQIAVMRNSENDYRTYMRIYVSGAWKDWHFDLEHVNAMITAALPTYFHSIGLYGDNSTYSNIDTLPVNSFLCFYGSGATGLQNVPWLDVDISTIQVATISTSDTLAAGTMQILTVRDADDDYRICVRTRIGSTWKAWVGLNGGKILRRVREDGSGNFTSVVSAIKWTMDNPPTKELPVIIDIGEGEFSLVHTVTLIGQNEMDSRGLFLMPYTTIRGRGPDKTVLTFYYDGSSDTIASQVSGLNVAYESELRDLSIQVKNLRYVFHADYALSSETSGESNAKLKNNTFRMENVVAVHQGYSTGVSPTYKVPAVWGGGLRTNQKRIFENCVFESYEHMAWFTHDWDGITQGSEVFFDGCSFITHKQDVAAIRFISWGSDCKHNVNIKNCVANSFMSFGVNTSYNEDATIDYFVKAADLNILVIEDSTNDANKKENYYTADTVKCLNYTGGTLNKFTPVHIQSCNKAYGPTSAGLFGIATHSAASGKPVNVQTKGFVNIETSGISAGSRITYSGGAWVQNANGELMVLGSNVCVIL